MTRLQVFDGPMCCATGVCGPSVDPRLAQVAADLEWLKSHGVQVERFNLAQEPRAFAEHAVVKQALKESGNDCLPLILIDGEIVVRGEYPARDVLAALVGIEAADPRGLYSRAVEELVALGAAIGANCQPCFTHHFHAARQAGVSRDDIVRAVATARQVKDTATRLMMTHAGQHLAAARAEESLKPGLCCPGSTDDTPRSSGCCG